MSGRWTSRVQREVLPNGLVLLAEHDPTLPAVAIVTHVKAGFFDEPDAWIGVSHVLEHMFFKGTPTRGPGRIAQETKAAGGWLNASTSYDRTAYYAVLPVEGFAEGLDVQADALRRSLVDEDELARELQVIIQEAKRKLDTPSALTQETLFELLFDVHRMRRWRIGTEAQLATYRRADIHGYYASRYVPGNTIVALVGGLPAEQMLAEARAQYADWAPAPLPVDRSPSEPLLTEIRARTLRGDVAQGELMLGWRTVPQEHPQAPALDLAGAVLSSGRGARLVRQLRETGLALDVAAWHYTPSELGVFCAGAEFEAEQLEPVLDALAREIAAMAVHGPTDEELERARTMLEASWAQRLESAEGRATTFAAAEAMGGLHLLEEDWERLRAVTPEQVRAAVAEHLRPEAVRAVAHQPHERGTSLDRDALANAFAVAFAEARVSPPVVMPARRPAPAAVAVVGAGRTLGVYHHVLPGADLLVIPKPGVPLVALGLHALRPSAESAALAGVGTLAGRAAVRGAAGDDAAELALRFERLGGGIGASVSADAWGVGTMVLSEHLGEAARALADVYFAPTFADDVLERERKMLAAETAQVADDMFRHPFQLAFGAAFGDGLYGVPVQGTPNSLATLTPGDVRTWHADFLAGARPVFVAAGDLDPEATLGLLAAIAAEWPARTGALRGARVASLLGAEPQMLVVERDRKQSAFAMVFDGPGRLDAERHAADVWSAIASGLGGRLFDVLRDKKSLAYTVTASSWQRLRGGALVSYIATSPEREEEARTEMLRELQRFGETPPEPEEFARAVRYLAGQARTSRQTIRAVMGEVLDAWLCGEPLEALDDPAAAYRAVTPEQVRALAERYLVPGRRAEGVIRGSGGGR
jgi:zinc protease